MSLRLLTNGNIKRLITLKPATFALRLGKFYASSSSSSIMSSIERIKVATTSELSKDGTMKEVEFGEVVLFLTWRALKAANGSSACISYCIIGRQGASEQNQGRILCYGKQMHSLWCSFGKRCHHRRWSYRLSLAWSLL